jgi:YD repeat-containing protein
VPDPRIYQPTPLGDAPAPVPSWVQYEEEEKQRRRDEEYARATGARKTVLELINLGATGDLPGVGRQPSTADIQQTWSENVDPTRVAEHPEHRQDYGVDFVGGVLKAEQRVPRFDEETGQWGSGEFMPHIPEPPFGAWDDLTTQEKMEHVFHGMGVAMEENPKFADDINLDKGKELYKDIPILGSWQDFGEDLTLMQRTQNIVDGKGTKRDFFELSKVMQNANFWEKEAHVGERAVRNIRDVGKYGIEFALTAGAGALAKKVGSELAEAALKKTGFKELMKRGAKRTASAISGGQQGMVRAGVMGMPMAGSTFVRGRYGPGNMEATEDGGYKMREQEDSAFLDLLESAAMAQTELIIETLPIGPMAAGVKNKFLKSFGREVAQEVAPAVRGGVKQSMAINSFLSEFGEERMIELVNTAITRDTAHLGVTGMGEGSGRDLLDETIALGAMQVIPKGLGRASSSKIGAPIPTEPPTIERKGPESYERYQIVPVDELDADPLPLTQAEVESKIDSLATDNLSSRRDFELVELPDGGTLLDSYPSKASREEFLEQRRAEMAAVEAPVEDTPLAELGEAPPVEEVPRSVRMQEERDAELKASFARGERAPTSEEGRAELDKVKAMEMAEEAEKAAIEDPDMVGHHLNSALRKDPTNELALELDKKYPGERQKWLMTKEGLQFRVEGAQESPYKPAEAIEMEEAPSEAEMSEAELRERYPLPVTSSEAPVEEQQEPVAPIKAPPVIEQKAPIKAPPVIEKAPAEEESTPEENAVAVERIEKIDVMQVFPGRKVTEASDGNFDVHFEGGRWRVLRRDRINLTDKQKVSIYNDRVNSSEIIRTDQSGKEYTFQEVYPTVEDFLKGDVLVSGSIRTSNEAERAADATWDVLGTIEVAGGRGTDQQIETLAHEAVHAAHLSGLWTDKEWAVLVKAYSPDSTTVRQQSEDIASKIGAFEDPGFMDKMVDWMNRMLSKLGLKELSPQAARNMFHRSALFNRRADTSSRVERVPGDQAPMAHLDPDTAGEDEEVVNHPDGTSTVTMDNGDVFEYNSDGLLVSGRVPSGKIFEYDPDGQVISITSPGEPTVHYDPKTGQETPDAGKEPAADADPDVTDAADLDPDATDPGDPNPFPKAIEAGEKQLSIMEGILKGMGDNAKPHHKGNVTRAKNRLAQLQIETRVEEEFNRNGKTAGYKWVEDPSKYNQVSVEERESAEERVEDEITPPAQKKTDSLKALQSELDWRGQATEDPETRIDRAVPIEEGEPYLIADRKPRDVVHHKDVVATIKKYRSGTEAERKAKDDAFIDEFLNTDNATDIHSVEYAIQLTRELQLTRKAEDFEMAQTIAQRYRDINAESARIVAYGKHVGSPLQKKLSRLEEAIFERDKMTLALIKKRKSKDPVEAAAGEKAWEKELERLDYVRKVAEDMGYEWTQEGMREITKNRADQQRLVQAALYSKKGNFVRLLEINSEYTIGSMLSGLNTLYTNLVSGPANAAFLASERRSAAVANEIFNPTDITLTDYKLAKELKQLGITELDLSQIIQDSFNNGLTRLLHEYGPLEDSLGVNEVQQFEIAPAIPEISIGGKRIRAGRAVRGVLGLGPMAASDQFMKTFYTTLNVRLHAAHIARTEALTYNKRNPDKDKLTDKDIKARAVELLTDRESSAWKAAYQDALEITFQDEGGPISSAVIKKVMDLKSGDPVGGSVNAGAAIGKLAEQSMFLFVRTPIRMFSQVAVRTPGLGTGLSYIKYRNNIKNGRPALEGVPPHFISQLGVSLMVSLLFMDDEDPLEGFFGLSGSLGSLGEEQRKFGYESVPKNAVRFGDTWIKTDRLDPFDILFATLIDGVKSVQKGRGAKQLAWDVTESAFATAKEKSVLRSFKDVTEAFSGARKGGIKESGTNWMESALTRYIPGLVSQTARFLDEDIYSSQTDSMGNNILIKAGVKAGDPVINLWGDPAKREKHLVTPDTQKADIFKGSLAFQKWNVEHTDDKYQPMEFDGEYTDEDGSKVKFDGADKSIYQVKTGLLAKKLVDALVPRIHTEEPDRMTLEVINLLRSKAKAIVVTHYEKHGDFNISTRDPAILKMVDTIYKSSLVREDSYQYDKQPTKKGGKYEDQPADMEKFNEMKAGAKRYREWLVENWSIISGKITQ